MQSIDALGAALDEFEGGVVLITHDAHICHKVGWCNLNPVLKALNFWAPNYSVYYVRRAPRHSHGEHQPTSAAIGIQADRPCLTSIS